MGVYTHFSHFPSLENYGNPSDYGISILWLSVVGPFRDRICHRACCSPPWTPPVPPQVPQDDWGGYPSEGKDDEIPCRRMRSSSYVKAMGDEESGESDSSPKASPQKSVRPEALVKAVIRPRDLLDSQRYIATSGDHFSALFVLYFMYICSFLAWNIDQPVWLCDIYSSKSQRPDIPIIPGGVLTW